MRIICVSMGTYGGAKQVAHSLADKMGYPCLCREDLIEAATREGIQVGKLEMAMIKPRMFGEQLDIQCEPVLHAVRPALFAG